MKIAVIGGCGYVGLITGVGFAELGHSVVAIDADSERVDQHQGGSTHIYETELPGLLQRLVRSGAIRFTTDMESGIADADIVFVAVGSPTGIDGETDLSQVRNVTSELARAAPRDAVIVVKSTVPVGVVDEMSSVIGGSGIDDAGPEVIVNPEFLGEGTGLHDFFNPARIVIGGGSDAARDRMRSLYRPFVEGDDAEELTRPMARRVPYLEVSVADAQMIKYGSNAYLASRISFVNEIASICEAVGADASDVVSAMGLDPRIGASYLKPGIGFGGPCLEKDLDALISFAKSHGYDPDYLGAVRVRNDEQMNSVVRRATDMVGGCMEGKRVCILGMAFKPGTNDVRTSLSLRIIRSLKQLGAIVVGHDPIAIPDAITLLPEIEYREDPYDAAASSDLLLILTAWPEYRELDLARLGELMRTPAIFDGQNCLSGAEAERAGFVYAGIGQTTVGGQTPDEE